MNTWRLAFGVMVLTGCTATLDPPAGAGGGAPVGPGSGGTGSSSGTGGGGGTGTVSCMPGVPSTSQLPRLTNAQYDATIRDLLGLTTLTASAGSTPSNLLATDQAGGLTDVGWAAYKTVGEAISTQVMADPTLKAKFISCDPAVGTCLHDTVVSFGRKAFRRPLSVEEVAAFDAVIAAGPTITATGAPAEVAEALLYMFLISPGFLQREELEEVSDGAGHFNLSSYEVASRLSYMLWGSTPDATLNQAADAQQLGTPAQVLAQAERMIQDPKARDMTQAFHRTYMLMGLNTRWDNTNKDSTKFPAFKREFVPALQQETEMFFDDVVFAKKGTFNDLLTSTTAFVSASTAPLYGLDASKFNANLAPTTIADRPGFLTRLGFLNAFSGYTGTSPILRGAFITKEVLGIEIGAPPPGAEQTPLPPASEVLDTQRKRYEELTKGAMCQGCHAPFINPPGFALEAFNTVGSWETMDADSGTAIDSTADIAIDATGTNTVHVTGPAELMAAIATAPGAKTRYVSKWVSFAYQREGHPDDACTVAQLAAKMTTSGYTVLNLMSDLTQTLSFRVRAVDP